MPPQSLLSTPEAAREGARTGVCNGGVAVLQRAGQGGEQSGADCEDASTRLRMSQCHTHHRYGQLAHVVGLLFVCNTSTGKRKRTYFYYIIQETVSTRQAKNLEVEMPLADESLRLTFGIMPLNANWQSYPQLYKKKCKEPHFHRTSRHGRITGSQQDDKISGELHGTGPISDL